ncbi:hypothetical protein [Methylobacterium sp. WSM2598]|uniref:hypothetical protein n=1 Tax=Methylobacterium sp. WSM2598 TaxID=398261 RepID=UPI0003715042|nr:hypothetical protein [Methylobacterium sp. WSM2598]
MAGTVTSRNEDRRAAERAPRFPQGRVLLPGVEPVKCLVRDRTTTGAKLGLAAEVALPLAFKLLLIEEDGEFPVEERWRRGDWVGVQFRPSSP